MCRVIFLICAKMLIAYIKMARVCQRVVINVTSLFKFELFSFHECHESSVISKFGNLVNH